MAICPPALCWVFPLAPAAAGRPEGEDRPAKSSDQKQVR